MLQSIQLVNSTSIYLASLGNVQLLILQCIHINNTTDLTIKWTLRVFNSMYILKSIFHIFTYIQKYSEFRPIQIKAIKEWEGHEKAFVVIK